MPRICDIPRLSLALMFTLATLSGCRPHMTSSTRDIAGIPSRLVTGDIGDACHAWGDQAFDRQICERIRGRSPLPGTNTGTCGYYCDPLNACVSPFGSTGDLMVAIERVEAWALMPANAAGSAAAIAHDAYTFLSNVIPLVTTRLRHWEPELRGLQNLASGDNAYTRGLCAANIIQALSRLIVVARAVNSDLPPQSPYPTGYVTENIATALTQTTCLALATVSSCGKQLGFSPAEISHLAPITLACSVGTMLASTIQCQTARNCCMAERDTATGIAPAIQSTSGRTSRVCCECVRQVWEDRAWPRRDILLSERTWRSVTTAIDGPSADCELRTGREYPSLIPDERGRQTYSTFQGCRKIAAHGSSCF